MMLFLKKYLYWILHFQKIKEKMAFYKKLRHWYIWKRIFLERLAEPIHLNYCETNNSNS